MLRKIFFLVFSPVLLLYTDEASSLCFKGSFQEYETHRLDLVAKFLPNNPIIFEAGGHYGTDTVKLAHQWPNGTIISFEPNPNAFHNLIKNTRGLSNVYSYNLAVNNYNGTAILNLCYGSDPSFGPDGDPIYEGASSLLEASDFMEIHYRGPKIEVPCVKLDDWCAINNINYIDFMWLDLDGLELQVFIACPQIIKNVKVIYTETNFLNFRKGTTQFKDLEKFLRVAGFKLFAHWYTEGLQGDAIFVKREIFKLGFQNQKIENTK